MSPLAPSIRFQPECAGKASLPPACLLSSPCNCKTFCIPFCNVPVSYNPFAWRFGQQAYSLPMTVSCRLSKTAKRLFLQHQRQRDAQSSE